MSILDLEGISNNLKSKWKEVSLPTTWVLNQEILQEDKILLKTSNNSYQEVQLCLTSKYIYYKTSETTLQKLNITWSLIDSFYEEDSEFSLYGFSLIKSGSKHDFFTTSDSILEHWLEKLSNLCLLTGFEQDFLVIKTLDSGNFGNVKLCQDLITSNQYAVKCIKKSFLQTKDQISHLRQEIICMRKVNHPGCVEFFRVYEEIETIYLILELVPQGNLLTRLQKLKKFQEFEVSLLARRLIETVSYLSSVGVVHRDIKLENILLSSYLNNFEVKLADFGLASSNQPLTEKCGSPGFMAPEVLEGLEYDSKADVFSVGVVCFALLTGKLPFASKQVKDILDKNQKCEVKFDKQVWKGYSGLAVNFVQGLLNKKKENRPSAEQALMHPWLSCFIGKQESENIGFGITCSELM
jgi:hypothetical protein